MQPLQNCIGPTICIGWEILCLPYAGFFSPGLWGGDVQENIKFIKNTSLYTYATPYVSWLLPYTAVQYKVIRCMLLKLWIIGLVLHFTFRPNRDTQLLHTINNSNINQLITQLVRQAIWYLLCRPGVFMSVCICLKKILE